MKLSGKVEGKRQGHTVLVDVTVSDEGTLEFHVPTGPKRSSQVDFAVDRVQFDQTIAALDGAVEIVGQPARPAAKPVSANGTKRRKPGATSPSSPPESAVKPDA